MGIARETWWRWRWRGPPTTGGSSCSDSVPTMTSCKIRNKIALINMCWKWSWSTGWGHRGSSPLGTGYWNSTVILPADMTCSQCILQWTYTAGNDWGTCENGTQAVGCGPQEQFRACADIEIVAAHEFLKLH